MKQLRAALARIAGFFTGHRADDDLQAELQSHLDMETAEHIRRGMHPDEARRQALLTSALIPDRLGALDKASGGEQRLTALDRWRRGRHSPRPARAAPQPRLHHGGGD